MSNYLKNKWSVVAPFLLFTGMGAFSFILLINHYGLDFDVLKSTTLAIGFILTILFFNVLGGVMLLSGRWMINRYPHYYGKQQNFIIHFILMSVVLFIVNLSLFLGLKYVISPDRVFLFRPQGVVLLLGIWFAEIIIMSLVVSVHSLQNALRLSQEKKKLEEESFHSRFMALHSQLNPHFLFNSLNTLIAEIDYDPEVAIQFTQNLSDVYRYTLQQQEHFTVSLKEEVEFLDAFIFLHQVRLGNGLKVEHSLTPSDLKRKLPPLTLQILAENVIKHNYIGQGDTMLIELIVDDQQNTLTFRNTLKPKNVAQRSGKGLNNLRERYKLLCQQSIVVEQTSTHFIITLPLLYE